MKILFLIFIFSTCAFAQSIFNKPLKPCDLTLKDAPKIRGFELGMQRADFMKRFPNMRDNVASDEIIIGYKILPFVDGFANVSRIWATFYDDKMLSFDIRYDIEYAKWEHSKEFADSISATYKLPVDSWETDFYATLQCKEFDIKLQTVGSQIVLTNTLLKEQKEKEEKQAEENKKKVFKP